MIATCTHVPDLPVSAMSPLHGEAGRLIGCTLLSCLILASVPANADASRKARASDTPSSISIGGAPKVGSICNDCQQVAAALAGDSAQPVQTGSEYGLDSLIDLTIRNHPSVVSRRAEHLAAQAEVDVARQGFYPTPSAQVQQGRGNQGMVLALQQPLWTGGRLQAGLNAADAHARSTDVGVTEIQLALALRVTSAYEAWLQANSRQAVLQRSISQLELYVERINRRIQGGASAAVDRELVIARLTQSQSDLAIAGSAERNALVQLSQLSGRDLRAGQLMPASAIENVAPQNLARLHDAALARDPALRRLDLDIETTQFETEQRRAALWPSVSLRAENQRSAAASGQPGVRDNRIFLVMEYTPGAGLSAGSQIEASRARTQGLRATREAARRDLLERVAIDHENYQTGLTRQRDLQRTLAASSEVLASYDRLFVAGKRGWLDVLNAARELTQVELAAADIAPQLIGNRYRLHLLAGEQPWLQTPAASARAGAAASVPAVPAASDHDETGTRLQTALIERSQR